MRRERNSRNLFDGAVVAVSLVALFAMQPTAAGAGRETLASAPPTVTVALLTTRDFRVAVVAQRLNGGATPTAEVRIAGAQRAGGGWREFGEMRLDETYFWRTVTGPRAVCRLEIKTAGSRASFRPYVAVRLLLSPSLGCARTTRFPLTAR